MKTLSAPGAWLQLRCLGGFDVQCPGGSIRLESAKTLALLVYLAANRTWQPRQRLADLLWGSLPKAAARRNLRHAIWNLRRELTSPAESQSLLISTHCGVELAWPKVWLDSAALADACLLLPVMDKLAGSDCADAQQAAVEGLTLYQGEFLDGLQVEDAPAFDAWAQAERERIRLLVRNGLLSLSHGCQARGDDKAALRYARQALEVDGQYEASQHQVVHLTALLGNTRAAFGQAEASRLEPPRAPGDLTYVTAGLRMAQAPLPGRTLTSASALADRPALASAKHPAGNWPGAQAGAAASRTAGEAHGTHAAPLRILGLGGFSVWQGARRVPDRDWQRRRAGELLCFLLLQPGCTARRDQVLEVLWPKQPPLLPTALYHATSAMRRVLEPGLHERSPSRYLAFESEHVTLRLPSQSWLDFTVFECQLRAALAAAAPDPAALSSVLALYHGDLFPMHAYADWSAAARLRLADLYHQGLLALAGAALAGNDARAALEHCRTLLQRDPWQEDAALLAMRACLALGQRPAALRIYRQLQHTLHAELGLTPRPDLQALAVEITQH